MVRRALFRQTPENEPELVYFHGFFQETFLSPPEAQESGMVHKAMAMVENQEGIFFSIEPECIKLQPATAVMAERQKQKNNSKIVKL